eukprot:SAG25_NODE_6217_length_578_cov_0.747390_1_plen_42_part_10
MMCGGDYRRVAAEKHGESRCSFLLQAVVVVHHTLLPQFGRAW